MRQRPKHTKSEVDRAGLAVSNPETCIADYEYSMQVIDNWRASHTFPMNTYAVNLKKQVADIEGAMVVQRIKRLKTILHKFDRQPKMRLSQMQDLGGCRVIVSSIADVYTVRDRFIDSIAKDIPPKVRDYIVIPNPETGYRGIHVICKYKGKTRSEYDGLQIEIQIRTRLQHLWATADETLGQLTGNGIKYNQGDPDWIRFFRLVSALFALEEQTPMGEGVDPNPAIFIPELLGLAYKLRIYEKIYALLRITRHMTRLRNSERAKFYLLSLDLDSLSLSIIGYNNRDIATEQYLKLEKQSLRDNTDIVLVYADSLEALNRAYPNYFSNLKVFSNTLVKLIGKYYDFSKTES